MQKAIRLAEIARFKDEVPVGADVEVIFEKLPNGQHVPEWKISN